MCGVRLRGTTRARVADDRRRRAQRDCRRVGRRARRVGHTRARRPCSPARRRCVCAARSLASLVSEFCRLFLSLSRLLKLDLSATLHVNCMVCSELLPYADALLQACAAPMAISVNVGGGDNERRLAYVEQLGVYEALGVVLGQSSATATGVELVLRALLDALARLAADDELRRPASAAADLLGAVLAQHVNALAHFCKGAASVSLSMCIASFVCALTLTYARFFFTFEQRFESSAANGEHERWR